MCWLQQTDHVLWLRKVGFITKLPRVTEVVNTNGIIGETVKNAHKAQNLLCSNLLTAMYGEGQFSSAGSD